MGMIEEVQSSSYHGKGGNANQRDTEICRKHKAQEEIGDGSALHYDLQGQSDTNRRQNTADGSENAQNIITDILENAADCGSTEVSCQRNRDKGDQQQDDLRQQGIINKHGFCVSLACCLIRHVEEQYIKGIAADPYLSLIHISEPTRRS